MRIFIIILATIFFSCKSNEATTKVESKPQTVIFSELSSGTNGGFSEKMSKIITSQNEFNEIWSTTFNRFSEAPKPPRIDLENKMIILVTMGIKNSGGHTIKISNVLENKSDITVTITETKPGTSCATTDVMTFPYQIVELKKIDKKAIFKTLEETYNYEE